jgi:hypothetical protein
VTSPIAAEITVVGGDVRITAGDAGSTSVTVVPSDASNDEDRRAAEQTRVEYANGRLLVHTPKGWRKWSPLGPWGGRESIDVQIDVPAGSSLSGQLGVGAMHATGRIGRCGFRIGVGEIRVDEADSVELRTGAGDVVLGRVDGAAEVTTGSGAVGITRVDGRAVVKNGNGDTWIGEVTGDVRVNAANGRISIDHAHAGAVAKTANGDVRLGRVERGAVVAQSAFGTVEVGVADRVAAWLDLDTKFGTVHNDLDAAERPEPSEETVELHAQTSMGDIRIHRSARDVEAGMSAPTSR